MSHTRHCRLSDLTTPRLARTPASFTADSVGVLGKVPWTVTMYLVIPATGPHGMRNWHAHQNRSVNLYSDFGPHRQARNDPNSHPLWRPVVPLRTTQRPEEPTPTNTGEPSGLAGGAQPVLQVSIHRPLWRWAGRRRWGRVSMRPCAPVPAQRSTHQHGWTLPYGKDINKKLI